MPLNCDCYGGCWGDHSKDWPLVAFTNDYRTNPMPAWARKALLDSGIPYGSFVITNHGIRVERAEYVPVLVEALNELKFE